MDDCLLTDTASIVPREMVDGGVWRGAKPSAEETEAVHKG